MSEGRLDEPADAGVVGSVLGDDRVEEGVDAVGRGHRAEEDRLEGVAGLGDVGGRVRGLQHGRADVVARRVEHPPAAAHDGLGAQAVSEHGKVVARLEAAAGVAQEWLADLVRQRQAALQQAPDVLCAVKITQAPDLPQRPSGLGRQQAPQVGRQGVGQAALHVAEMHRIAGQGASPVAAQILEIKLVVAEITGQLFGRGRFEGFLRRLA